MAARASDPARAAGPPTREDGAEAGARRSARPAAGGRSSLRSARGRPSATRRRAGVGPRPTASSSTRPRRPSGRSRIAAAPLVGEVAPLAAVAQSQPVVLARSGGRDSDRRDQDGHRDQPGPVPPACPAGHQADRHGQDDQGHGDMVHAIAGDRVGGGRELLGGTSRSRRSRRPARRARPRGPSPVGLAGTRRRRPTPGWQAVPRRSRAPRRRCSPPNWSPRTRAGRWPRRPG